MSFRIPVQLAGIHPASWVRLGGRGDDGAKEAVA